LTEVIEKRAEERQKEIIDRVLKLAAFRNEWANSAE